MTLTVGELIEMLGKLDPETEVVRYVGEDWGMERSEFRAFEGSVEVHHDQYFEGTTQDVVVIS